MTFAKKFAYTLASFVLVLAMVPAAAFAKGAPYLLDEYGLYSSSEASSIESRAESLADKYGIGVYLWVTDSVNENARRDTAMDYYTDHDLGVARTKAASCS